MIWFTSDTHFWHRNIIKLCRPQFSSVEEMNQLLVNNWNDTVGDEDTVYHLGDVSFAGTARTFDIIDRLNGYKILIRGNHDPREAKMMRRGFDEVLGHALYGGYVLRHEPDYDDMDAPTICGHVHGRWKRVGNHINAGVDVWNYRPVSLRELETAVPQTRDLVDYH